MEFGFLVVFRKGKSSAPYELDEGEHSIGSSMDSNIRLKFSHPLLMSTHALIKVNENGVATIVNKSSGAPVKVNGKAAFRPTILRHEDQFEILDKVFQYFNECLKNEPEDSEKFVKEKRNILAKNRQSVNPLIKTPAKKSPNLKTKIPSIRKSASAVPRATKGLQVIITPNKKPDDGVGSKTTSKIIVSKALVSPRSAKKRRLSLGNSIKASQSPKISSRNILLSKSTINITISEEHEYSEVAPSTSMRTIQENEVLHEDVMKTKGRTPKRSIKVENGDTPSKDISVALIDFDSPAINSPRKGRSVQHQTGFKTEDINKELMSIDNSSNVMKTPVNKRIQSLKTVRHSLKKDTPPPRITLPKVTIQPPTPQGRRVADISLKEQSDISISYSPNAEPSTHNLTQRENKTPRRSGTPANKSRVSFAIEAPTEASPINYEAPNESNRFTDTDNEICVSEKSLNQNNPRSSRISSNRSVVNDEFGTPEARRSTKSKQSLVTEELDPVLELHKGRRSSRYSLNSTKKLEDNGEQLPEESQQKGARVSQGTRRSKTGDPLLMESPDGDVEEQDTDLPNRNNFRNIIISASTDGSDTERRSLGRKSGRRSSKLETSQLARAVQRGSFSKSPNKSSRTSASASARDGGILIEDEKLAEPLKESDSSEDMDELQIDATESPLDFTTRASLNYSCKKTDKKSISERPKKGVGLDKSTDSSVREASTNIEGLANFSQTEDNATDAEDHVDKPSRVSRNASRRSTKIERSLSPSQTEDNSTDAESNKSSRVSRNASRRSTKIERSLSPSQTEDNTTDAESNVSQSSRVSRNASRRSTKIDESADSSQTKDSATDAEDHSSEDMDELQIDATESPLGFTTRASLDYSSSKKTDKSISERPKKGVELDKSTDSSVSEADASAARPTRLPGNVSKRSSKLEPSGNSLLQDNSIDSKDTASNSFRLSINASRNNISSHLEDNATDSKENVNYASRLSQNVSRRSKQLEEPTTSSFTDDKVPDINKLSRVSRKSFSKSTKIEESPSSSQTEDSATDADDHVNKSSRVSRNASRRNTKIDESADSSQTEDSTTDAQDNVNKSSRVSRNASRRSRIIERSLSPSQTEDNTTDAENHVSKSSRVSRNASRRSTKINESADSSQTKDSATDAEDQLNKSSRVARNDPRRSTKIERSLSSSQTEHNTTDAEDDVSKSSKVSRNASKRSAKIAESFPTEESISKSSRLSKNISQSANASGIVPELPTHTPNRSWSRRSTRALNSQSSVDSAETTVNVQQNNGKEPDKSRQGLSLFDESTQEAKPAANVSKNRSQQRVSIFDESTREVLPGFGKSTSVNPIDILDDTQEVLSPVRPLSPKKSIRNIENQDDEGSIRVSLTRRSRTLQDSSLTSTSMDQSSGSVISVSSQSFSSFKKGSARREASRDESEIIDVVNISSTIDVTTEKRSSWRSGGNVKDEVLEESNASRSSKRQSITSEMFRDVSCTSTPFQKQNASKKSQESETSGSKNVTQSKRGSSSAISTSKPGEIISISSASDSVFMNSSAEQRSRSSTGVSDDGAAVRRRSSSRSSVSKQIGEHNCVSCRNSSVKRSRSLSTAGEPTVVDGITAPASLRRSKTLRKSSEDAPGRGFEETSPVRRISSATSSKMTTPLLHRKSLATSLSENTPEKAAEMEDETPKSSIKPARRSSKANHSAYNPLLEDITPVTPEKLMVSGFTEDVFKTPINTPGLFENIRKSAIRSRKRHRESTGSTMKDSKRARVDFAQEEEQLETSTDDLYLQQKPRKSPVNRLSNFEGVKKLMRTPPKSPKNDLRNVPNLRNLVSPKQQASPKNDLTNVAGVKKMFGTPKDAKSPRNDLTNIPNLRRLVSPKRQNTPKNDLTRIPNLRRIMSPKHQNSPKNDLSSPVGIKRLLKTPRVQKEPVDDLGNVTGVANIFNVSGVEVLHQGSDIENSEDLFTKLTGKRPMRAYPRGQSLSPNKEEQQKKPLSRKTMGDIPISSPRVQQWVEDHANVMSESEDEDVFFNVSGNQKRKSKIGRSVSPKKTVREAKNRRKTQGDARGDSPNVPAWKAETKTGKLSTAGNAGSVKTELLSPNPIQTLQPSSMKAEKVTPQQLKSKTEMLTPQQQTTPLGDSVTPASVRARKGTPRLVTEAKQDENEAITSSVKNKTPKIAPEDQQQKVLDTPKEIINKPIAAVKRGGRGKRIMSTEELDVVSSTTGSPVQEPLAMKTRTRRGGGKIGVAPDINPEGDTPEISTKTRRGKTGSQSGPVSDDLETKAATIPRGRRAQKQSESESVDEREPKKPGRGRPRKNKIDEIQATPEVSASPGRRGGRRGKKAEEETTIENKQVGEKEISEAEEKPASRSRRGRKIDGEQDPAPVEEVTRTKPIPKGRAVKKDTQEPGNMEKVAEVQDVKKTASGRRGRHLDRLESTESDMSEQIENVPVKKPAPKGRRGKKEEPQVTEIDDDNAITPNELQIKKPSRSRRVKKSEDDETREPQSANLVHETEEPVVKKTTTRSRRGRNVEEKREENPEETSDTEVEFKKSTRGRSKKGESQVSGAETQNVASPAKKSKRGAALGKDVSELTPSSPVVKATRSRRGAKVVEVQTDIEERNVTEKLPAKRHRGKKIYADEPESEEDTESTASVESFKKASRGRGKKEEIEPQKTTKKGGKSVETPEIESPKKPSTRARGKKVTEETTEDQASSSHKQNTRKPRNKVIEELIEIDVDSPRTARAKRGVNKKYSTDEYEVIEKNSSSKRKVRFEDDSDVDGKKGTPEVNTKKSKRTRK